MIVAAVPFLVHELPTAATILSHMRSYDHVLLAVSFVLACSAAYVLASLHAHVITKDRKMKIVWLIVGAILIGTTRAIFLLVNTRAMAFPGSSHVFLPSIFAMYASSILSSAISLFFCLRSRRGAFSTSACTLLLGTTLVGSQLFCLDAVLYPLKVSYSYPLFLLLCVVTLGISYCILHTIYGYARPAVILWKRICAAIVMGSVFALISMFGSELANRVPSNVVVPSRWIDDISSSELYLLIALALAIILVILSGVTLSHRFSIQAENLELSETRLRMANALSEQRVIRMQNEALSEEIKERQKAESRLRYVAFHDSITQLYNRVFFMDALAKALHSVQDSRNYRSALLYIDLDNFKSVNDMFGHRVGDLVLVEVARRLQHCSRERDVLARLQGDEFTLLFENPKSMEQVYRVAQRILSLIEEPMSVAGAVLNLTASIGLCAVDPQASEPADILRDADTAMYQAKHQGGSRCLLYNSSMHEEALAAAQAKLELKAAVEHEEFELYYQPLVRMADASIYGMEALIRWNHPVRGLVSPGAFIPLAEETGHICSIGAWVLKQATLDFKLFREVFSRPLLLTLNVASQQLDEAGYLAQMTSTLESSGMEPESLQLEITESVLLKDAKRIGNLFRDIRALGIKIAFDDFGTGYSSLSYLERYPIDTLKIDQSFVQNMRKGSVNADIVRLVIEMAQVIGMSVSAEGVEEPEQAAALMERGCVVAQGYLYSRPITRAAMIEVLKGDVKLPKSNVIPWQAPVLAAVNS